MIHCIHPHRYDIGFHPRPPRPEDHVFAARAGDVLLDGEGDGAYLPTVEAALRRYPEVDDTALTYLFCVDGVGFYLLDDAPEAAAGHAYRPAGSFRGMTPRWRAFAGITAAHLAGWFGRNRFCGACGGPMTPKADERAMTCPACGLVVYPSISPAVIVAVTDGDRLLLTRYANRPFRNYALIAGFMEVGECLEDTIQREVLEETGVRVKNIRYYKSQPWAFSASMLAGFYADLDGSPELVVDKTELDEALWVPREEIPEQDVGVALTAEMIDAFRKGDFPA